MKYTPKKKGYVRVQSETEKNEEDERKKNEKKNEYLHHLLHTCVSLVNHYIFYFLALRTNERLPLPVANMSNENLQQTDSSSYASVNESSLSISTSVSSYHTARQSSNSGYETPTLQLEMIPTSSSSSLSDLTLAEASDEGKLFQHS